MNLVLNNLQRLTCHKTQQTKPTQTKSQFILYTRDVFFPEFHCQKLEVYIKHEYVLYMIKYNTHK